MPPLHLDQRKCSLSSLPKSDPTNPFDPSVADSVRSPLPARQLHPFHLKNKLPRHARALSPRRFEQHASFGFSSPAIRIFCDWLSISMNSPFKAGNLPPLVCSNADHAHSRGATICACAQRALDARNSMRSLRAARCPRWHMADNASMNKNAAISRPTTRRNFGASASERVLLTFR